MMFRRAMLGLLWGLMMVPLQSAWATGYALIVGASKYTNLDDRMQLDGPKYDAEMVSDYLKQKRPSLFPASNIKVLADGVAGAQLPTRGAIQEAMMAIAQQALAGDFVYLHFSGHGSRQPAKPTDVTETDGLDEMFLPTDIGAWDDKVGTVRNALIDDEIGSLIGGIRNKGAFVWVVFDSCHSGTVTRGAPVGADVRMRKVESAMLGIPQSAMDAAESSVPKTRGKGAEPDSSPFGAVAKSKSPGGFVAFYAAQSTEQTPEMRLPLGEEGRVPHGLFSFTLLQTLNEHPGITYRRAAQEVLQRYAAMNMDRPTPLFEGDLDARVFGSATLDEKPQWPVEEVKGELHIPVGTLSRIYQGSVVAFVSSPAADDKEAIAYARVSKATAMDSVLSPLEYRGKKALDVSALPAHVYARVVEQKLDFSLRVARPLWSADQPKDLQMRLRAVLDAIKPDEGSGLRLQWVDAGQPADLRLAWNVSEKGQKSDVDQIWFLPPSGTIVMSGDIKTPSVSIKGKDDAQLRIALLDNMTRIARVVNLLRVSQGMGAGATSLEVMLKVRRKADGSTVEVGAEHVPRLYPGDEVHLRAINSKRKPVDVNVLFIGSDYSISHWYKERIHPNGKLEAGLFKVAADSFGKERVLVITSEAKPESELLDLSFLAQKALPKTRGTTPSTGMAGLLQEAGFGGVQTRGVAPLTRDDEAGLSAILQFTIETTMPSADE